MKIKKSLLLILGALVMVMVACGDVKKSDKSNEKSDSTSVDENFNDSGMPIVDEPITLNFFAGQAPASAPDWNDLLVFNTYEDMTNIKIKWDMTPQSGLDEKRNLSLAAGDLPDAYHSSRMPVMDIVKYSEQGTFIPLNDLIDKYAPNFKKILNDNPDMRKALTFPDGEIYSFPQLIEPEFYSSRIGPVPWINREWLEKLNMDIPKTPEDFYDYLVAVKEQDPGGNNGVPYGAPNISLIVQWLQGAFGVANKGTVNANLDLDPETQSLRFYPITEEYKELLQFVNRLFEEELIEKNIFSIDQDQYIANAGEGLYGSTNWYGPVEIFGKEAGSKFVEIPALEGPHGHKMHTNLYSPVNAIGGFLITSENEYPEATVRWVDYFYGDEGQKLFFMGVEGETYEVTEDGQLEYVDEIINNPDGLTYDEAVKKYLSFNGGGYPSMITMDYYRGGASSAERLKAAETLKPDLVQEPWDAFIYTLEENDKLIKVGNDIDKYVIEMRDRFISGETPFSEWDDYVKTVENSGLEEYLSINQSALDRYEGD